MPLLTPPAPAQMDWGLYIGLTGVKAKFRTAQTRLLQHSEAIAALQGAETEKAILSKLFDQVGRKPNTHLHAWHTVE